MKIVIFAGGTGSAQLQSGMYHALDACLDGVDTKIIVNAYDNGLSTGAVRAVMDGRILGPSDVRKNQTTRLSLIDPRSPWLKFLGIRFTCAPADAMRTCMKETERLAKQLDDPALLALLCRAIATYFSFPRAAQIDYDDFSLANIIYAGIAAEHGFSLRAAARIMASAMGIADNVLLNDDASMYLGAVTRSGRRIHDEGEIVAWNDENDSFVSVFFKDPHGVETVPELCVEAWKAIVDADLVIFSSGTQWSSLIPTYVSGGFQEALDASRATLIMVMNRVPDKDAPGQTASELIELLIPRYLPRSRVHVVADANGHRNLCYLSQEAQAKLASFNLVELSAPETPAKQHEPRKLADAIASVYFGDYLNSDIYVFDYDDTLCSRQRGELQRTNTANATGISFLNSVTNVAICTGNAIKAVDLAADIIESRLDAQAGLRIFADGGINEYLLRPSEDLARDLASLHPQRCISPEALLPAAGPYSAEELMAALERAGIPRAMLSNRGNALIALRPIDDSRDRFAVMALARRIVNRSGLLVRAAGTSTIEICQPTLSKSFALKHLCAPASCTLRITYIGDELEDGNDRDIKELSLNTPEIRCLHVRSPVKTAYFIRTLTSHIHKHARH